MGIYASFAQVRADIPDGPPADLKKELQEEKLDQLNGCDYPVLFWLLLLLPVTHYVFELGGTIGRGYYGFRRYLPLPPDYRWVICELPHLVEAGRLIAQQRGDPNLAFTTEREVEGDPDIYYVSGALQYIEEPFPGMLRALRRLPPHVIVNRTPMVDREPYITLQRSDDRFAPYKVVNRAQFIAGMEALGYETRETWLTDRPVSFLLEPRYERPLYHGMYFRLKGVTAPGRDAA